MLRICLSKTRFTSGSSNLEVVRSSPPPGDQADKGRRQQHGQEIIDWLELRASLAVCDWLSLVFQFRNLEALTGLDFGFLR